MGAQLARMDEATRARIFDALRTVYDPELGVSVVDLGLIYGVDLRDDGTVLITMTLTTPGCPMHESLAQGVAAALDAVPGLPDGEIRLVFDPPWDPSRLTEEGKRLLGIAG
jgi:metal-sulfur cluster biosynthetic enzyme